MVYGQNYLPETRVGQTGVLIGDTKIYFIGGFHTSNSTMTEYIGNNPRSDFFYVDLNSDSAEDYFTCVDLRSQANLTLISWHIANLGTASQDSIFIVGGVTWDGTNTVYKFDTKTNELSVPVIQGIVPPARRGMNSVSYGGNIYMFGGQTGANDNANFLSNFDILDTINLNWKVGSLVNSPITRSLYTATLVNGVIYYIGGKSGRNIYSPMTEIYQYDIVGNTWTLKNAAADDINTMPGSRAGHSAVPVDNKIYIYGGSFSSENTPSNVPTKETIAILDTTTLKWSIPKLKDPNIPQLVYHTAVLLPYTIGRIMIISFGNVTNLPSDGDQTNKLSYFFILADPIEWVIMKFTTRENNTTPVKPSSDAKTEPPQPSTSNKMLIAGASVVSVVVVLVICVAFSLVYRHKKKNKNLINESGENVNNEVKS